MAEIRINEIPTFSGDPSGSWLIINNYAETVTSKIKREEFLFGSALASGSSGTSGTNGTSAVSYTHLTLPTNREV